MLVEINKVYKNSDNEYFTPAQTGDFYIVDVWECNKRGEVKNYLLNPCPVPIYTDDLIFVGSSKFNYSYPEFNPQF